LASTTLSNNLLVGAREPEKPTVLILDEQSSSQEVLSGFFSGEGFLVLCLDSTGDFLRFPPVRCAGIRLIVCSTTHPDLASRDLRRLFLAQFPLVPVIQIGRTGGECGAESADGVIVTASLDRPPSPEALSRALEASGRFSEIVEERVERELFLRQGRYLEEPLARILHDLNNQITGLKGGADLLTFATEGMEDSARQLKMRRYLDQFVQPSLAQIEQMIRVWRQLREGRLRSSGPCEVLQIVRQAVAVVVPPAHRGRVEIRMPGEGRSHGEPLMVLMNASQLTFGLAHIVQNAFEATSGLEEGRILIQIGESDDEMCCIEVFDNGPGIPESERLRIWRTFHSTKGDHRNGLGLSIAKQVVEKYQGQIECVPSPLGGAGIRVRVPRASRKPPSESV
jgi:signal transduction histidine kinase